MAKAQSTKAAGAPVVVEFPRTGNPWIDAGVVGLYRVLADKPAYVDKPAEADDPPDLAGVRVDLQRERLHVEGPAARVQASLEWAYDRLVATYFNVSSRKQKEDRSGHNFYYKTAENAFVTFSKKKAVGAASLLFDKAARPSGAQVAWALGTGGRREPGRLPPSHAHLQGMLDAFLRDEGLKPGPPAGLLIDGPNQVRPKVEIRVGSAGAKAGCFLTGEPATAPVEAKETAFPLLGGSRSFINGGADWPRLGWKADFVGKFVPAVTFFYLQSDELHLFFPESNDLRRIDRLADVLAARMYRLDPNLFRNFDFVAKLGGYLARRSEVALAFLHRVFVALTDQEAAERARREEAKLASAEKTVILGDDDEGGETAAAGPGPQAGDAPGAEPLISAPDVFRATQVGGPVGFAVVSAAKKGNVWMARDFWTFRDVVYLARLFDAMQRPVRLKSGVYKPRCAAGALFHSLMDYEANDQARSLPRDRVCEAVLRRQPVLHLLERHAFHVNTHADPGRSRPVGPLLQFARLYEVELRKGTEMDENDAYQAMVDTATWLGGKIGEAVAGAVNAKGENESRGRAKGALFRLRKTRTTADFMNELARLQFRYKIDVPQDVLDGRVFNPGAFEEFRGFCVVAALSKFLYATGEFANRKSPSQPSPTSGK
jgi:hypothetical protein